MTQHALDCVHVVHQLWDYLDGVLGEDQRARIVAHLEQCAACTSHFEFERSFLETVAKLRRDDAEFHELKTQVIAALRASGFSPAR